MNVRIKYNDFPNGIIHPVSSKSISNRVLIIDALTKNSCEVLNLSQSEDTQFLQQQLSILREKDFPVLDVGPAGTVMRFLTTYACLTGKEVVITGSARMKERPIGQLVDALNGLGAQISYEEKSGFPPIRIKPSVLKGNKVELDGSISSQFVSSLMLCAPYLENGLNIQLMGKIVSHSYILLTAAVMRDFGIEVMMENNQIIIPGGEYQARSYFVESDWSSASYFFSLAALSTRAQIELKYLRSDSLQGDKAIVDIMRHFGVLASPTVNGIMLEKSSMGVEKEFSYDFILCPDIAQTVAPALAGLALKKVQLSGLETLKVKETDRILALQAELGKFGVDCQGSYTNKLVFSADSFLPCNSLVNTYHDHRMAMGFAPLAQKTGNVIIENRDVVKKSYIRFWDDLISLGSVIENVDI